MKTFSAILAFYAGNENIFRWTGLLCGECTGARWIPRTKASDAELWSVPEQTAEQTIEKPVIWDVIVLIMTPLKWGMSHGKRVASNVI